MKLMVVQTGRIGDMILITPMFSAIKKNFPDSKLTILAGPHNYEIAKENPYVDHIWVYHRSPLGFLKTIANLKIHQFDYWIDPKDHESKQSKIIAGMARASHKIGYNSGNRVFDIDLPETSRDLHHTEIGLNALKPLGIELQETVPTPELYESGNSSKYVDFFLEQFNHRKILLLNISGSREIKMWNNESWTTFFHSVDISRYQLVITCAPPESKRAETLHELIPDSTLFQSRNIMDVISLVKRSFMVISPDTSIVHIASAFDKPLLALYSGLDNFYTKFHPTGSNYITVRAEEGDEGIKSIKPENVVPSFNKLIAKI